MDLDSWSKVLIAVLAVVAALLKLWEVRGARVAQLAELKTVIEVANELPNGSASRKAATAYVEEALNEFVRDFLIFGLTGLNQEAVRRERDARGRPVRSASSSREGVEPP
ncbi:hypothetical protein [Amycolatopsis magusensis]|uniref:hypothetical protein n=1 Tax=Amycolatopsis magusensis TaxID=882444 RepID=UPI0024A7EDBE|nr:hypothetical protein [Amycolatopsis magusensis]MDI5980496.1 hypothetical protein [Amycolatopsis magusensis]